VARRRQASTGATLLLILLMGAMFVLGYVAPFVIIALWAWSEYRARMTVQAESLGGESRTQLRQSIALSQRRIAELYQEGANQGLPQRGSDGRFDARYGGGRELNDMIAGEQDGYICAVQELANVVVPLARRDAMRCALIAYFGLLLYLWASSTQMNGFGMSLWSSLLAAVVGLVTYALRKAHYAEN
jgi:hypothetical protein